MPAIVRLAMGLLALLELVSSVLWILDPEKEEKNLSGLLLYSGCTSSIACGAEGVCAAYGRVMAWALLGLGMIRLMLCFGSGLEIWLIGILGHIIESIFWWSEYFIATLPRLRALPSAWTRAETLVLVAMKPPYSSFHVVLVGPPLLAIWIALSYYDFVPHKASVVQKDRLKEKSS